jgi:hypothetical protein
VLSSLLDLPGTVRLSECIEAMGRRRDETAVSRVTLATRQSQMRHHVAARLGVIRRRILRAYEAPVGGEDGLPDAAAMHAALSEAGALEAPSERRLAAVGRTLAAPYGQLFARTADAARREAIWLRHDVAEELRILGGEASRVELLDAVLQRATVARETRLRDGLRERIEAGFGASLGEAVRALPRDDDAPARVEALAPWFERGGWVRAHLDDGRQLALALIQHDCAAIQGLIDGACAAMNTED